MAGVTIHGPGEMPMPEQRAVAQPAPAVETPSQRIVKAANALSYVTDAEGRTLGWRKLDALEDFDLSEVAGGTNVGNAKWMMYAMLAFVCREIDGERLSRPTTRNELRARIKLLGSAGLDALYGSIVPADAAGEDEEGAPAEQRADEGERLKNS